MLESDHAPPTAMPRTWLLISDKLGDNAQARVLAEALGWAYETRQLFPKPEWVLGKPAFRPGLHHLDLERSAELEPPWPDLVVTIGRRCAMAALWIQAQSGGRTRIVLIGRPKRWAERFALIVAPRQFRIPPRPNLVQLDLPLLRADRAAVEEAALAWRERLAGLPRPLTAVLVGGRTRPYRFDAEAAQDLARRLRDLQARDGGSLYVSTSRRTGPGVATALAEALPPGTPLYRWSRETAAENPYLALLGTADRCVVTGDSISMLVEAASLGRPLAIYPLPPGRTLADLASRGLARLAAGSAAGGPVMEAVARTLQAAGIGGYARDLGEVHEVLLRRGLAVRLGEPFAQPKGGLDDELATVVARVKALLSQP